MHEESRERVRNAGASAFGPAWSVDGWAIAPGRIELIGNHTDYNGGPVLAAAIDRVIALGTGPIADPHQISLVAPDVAREPQSFQPMQLGDWHATPDDEGPVVYLKGVVAALASRGIPIRTGVGIAIAGDIPPAFGMSSSAALCLAAILALTADDIDPRDMVTIAREAEHRAGSPVGAMDQSASAAGNVIVFDGRDNSYRRITPDLGDYVFAVANSGVDRSLRTSSYGTRVRETEEACALLAQAYGLELPHLAALTPHWDDVEPTIGDHLSPTLVRRVRHIVTETLRVQEAEKAMLAGDWHTFGELMNASGESSARDYEISHPVVEELVAILRRHEAVLGARMMGGGEGGPALVLLRRDAVDDVARSLDEAFYTHHDVSSKAPFQVCSFGPGAHREPAG